MSTHCRDPPPSMADHADPASGRRQVRLAEAPSFRSVVVDPLPLLMPTAWHRTSSCTALANLMARAPGMTTWELFSSPPQVSKKPRFAWVLSLVHAVPWCRHMWQFGMLLQLSGTKLSRCKTLIH